MKTILKHFLLFLIFSILFILPTIFIPSTLAGQGESQGNTLMVFILLLTDLLAIVYLINRLELKGIKLFLATLVVFYGIQTFMTQIETWYFREAMPAITDQELLNLFKRPLITATIFIPLAIWILGKWKIEPLDSPISATKNISWSKVVWLSVSYVVIYFVFGYFIAWQFEAVRIFYTGSSEKPGFIEQIRYQIQTDKLIFPFQLLRGFLWIMVGMPIILYLKGGDKEKILACAILYSVLPVIQLIIENPVMPQQVRFVHFLEVGSSNAIFGLLIGSVLLRKKMKV